MKGKSTLSKIVPKAQYWVKLGIPPREALDCLFEMARTIKNPRMRIEYKPESGSYLVHDLSDNEVYYLSSEDVPEWAKTSMALLSMVEPETEVEGVGFFYAQGVFYLDIKTPIPQCNRRPMNAKQSGS